MTKTDDRINVKYPVTLSTLDALFEVSIKRLDEKINWYKVNSVLPQIATISISIFGILCISATILSPVIFILMGSPTSELDGVHIGYTAALIAGLLLLVDKVFMFSRLYAQFTSARMQISVIRTDLEFEWAQLRSKINTDATAEQRAKAAVLLCQKALAAADKVELQDTTNWQRGLSQAMKSLFSAHNHHKGHS